MYLEEYNEEETMQMFREEGREDGIAFGKRNNQLETARRMLADGLDTNLIVKYTGLDIQEVLKLTKKPCHE